MFTQKEKREHYNKVAKKEKSIKDPSKFSPQTQIDYARGQAHARNEHAAIFKYHNSTQEQRDAYKERQAIRRQTTLTGTCKKCGQPCGATYQQCYACNKASKANNELAPLPSAYKSTTATKSTKPKTAPSERKCGICKQYLSKCCC